MGERGRESTMRDLEWPPLRDTHSAMSAVMENSTAGRRITRAGSTRASIDLHRLQPISGVAGSRKKKNLANLAAEWAPHHGSKSPYLRGKLYQRKNGCVCVQPTAASHARRPDGAPGQPRLHLLGPAATSACQGTPCTPLPGSSLLTVVRTNRLEHGTLREKVSLLLLLPPHHAQGRASALVSCGLFTRTGLRFVCAFVVLNRGEGVSLIGTGNKNNLKMIMRRLIGNGLLLGMAYYIHHKKGRSTRRQSFDFFFGIVCSDFALLRIRRSLLR